MGLILLITHANEKEMVGKTTLFSSLTSVEYLFVRGLKFCLQMFTRQCFLSCFRNIKFALTNVTTFIHSSDSFSTGVFSDVNRRLKIVFSIS